MLDSKTLWTLDIRTVMFLLNSVAPCSVTFSEQQIIEALNALYDDTRNEHIDFDEFLYQLAAHDKVSSHAKWSRRLNVNRKPIAELSSVTCYVKSRIVTCHSAQANTPRLNFSQKERYSLSISQRERESMLSLLGWLVMSNIVDFKGPAPKNLGLNKNV